MTSNNSPIPIPALTVTPTPQVLVISANGPRSLSPAEIESLIESSKGSSIIPIIIIIAVLVFVIILLAVAVVFLLRNRKVQPVPEDSTGSRIADSNTKWLKMNPLAKMEATILQKSEEIVDKKMQGGLPGVPTVDSVSRLEERLVAQHQELTKDVEEVMNAVGKAIEGQIKLKDAFSNDLTTLASQVGVRETRSIGSARPLSSGPLAVDSAAANLEVGESPFSGITLNFKSVNAAGTEPAYNLGFQSRFALPKATGPDDLDRFPSSATAAGGAEEQKAPRDLRHFGWLPAALAYVCDDTWIFMHNGDSIKGKWKNRMLNGGPTIYIYHSSGNRYEGSFVDDVRHGEGTMFWKDKDTCFSGTWEHGHPVVGKYAFPNGDVYEGQMKKGFFNGTGKFIHACGDTYEGHWLDDYMDGYGVYRCKGNNYEGMWQRGKMHGSGSLRYFDGGKYVGTFAFGLRDGFGKFTEPDGSYYQGAWQCDLRHGPGKVVVTDGRVLEGHWYKGEFVEEESQDVAVVELSDDGGPAAVRVETETV